MPIIGAIEANIKKLLLAVVIGGWKQSHDISGNMNPSVYKGIVKSLVVSELIE